MQQLADPKGSTDRSLSRREEGEKNKTTEKTNKVFVVELLSAVTIRRDLEQSTSEKMMIYCRLHG